MEKILVIQTAFLGDSILSTSFLRELKKLFPDYLIDVLCIPETKQIFETNPNVNSLILFNKRKIISKIISFFKIIFELKKRKYDMAFSIQSSMTSSMIMLLSNIKKRIGFTRQKFITIGVHHTNGIHKIRKILRLLEPFMNYENCDMQTEIFYTKSENSKIVKIFNKNRKEKNIGIAPGSVWNTKRWPANYYKYLVEKLQDAGFQIFLIGGKADFKLCERIKGNSNALNFAGKLNIRESAALIEKLDIMITNDSAPLHIANAMKTDVIAFFGPTVRDIGFYPYRKNDFVFEIDLDCRPCGSHGHKKCPLGHHNCMKLITPDKVLKFILSRLAGGK